jgi:hypothetical protein
MLNLRSNHPRFFSPFLRLISSFFSPPLAKENADLSLEYSSDLVLKMDLFAEKDTSLFVKIDDRGKTYYVVYTTTSEDVISVQVSPRGASLFIFRYDFRTGLNSSKSIFFSRNSV